MSAPSSPVLRGLWIVSLGLLLLVFGAVTARWIGAGIAKPPSGWIPLAVGIAGMLVGLRRPRVRPVAWAAGWACLLWVAADLVQIQASLDRPLPTLYLGLFVALGLLVPTCVGQMRLTAKTPSGPGGLV